MAFLLPFIMRTNEQSIFLIAGGKQNMQPNTSFHFDSQMTDRRMTSAINNWHRRQHTRVTTDEWGGASANDTSGVHRLHFPASPGGQDGSGMLSQSSCPHRENKSQHTGSDPPPPNPSCSKHLWPGHRCTIWTPTPAKVFRTQMGLTQDHG